MLFAVGKQICVFTISCLHIRRAAHSSACAQACHCHHWLALWLSVTHWIVEKGTQPFRSGALNEVLSWKASSIQKPSTPPHLHPVNNPLFCFCFFWGGGHSLLLFGIGNEWCPRICTVYSYLPSNAPHKAACKKTHWTLSCWTNYLFSNICSTQQGVWSISQSSASYWRKRIMWLELICWLHIHKLFNHIPVFLFWIKLLQS